MSTPKLQVIVLFQNLGEEHAYYARSPSPPESGLLLAALTTPIVDVELLHEMVRPIDYETNADFMALSFTDYCAPHAYQVAARFRRLGETVVAGGIRLDFLPRGYCLTSTRWSSARPSESSRAWSMTWRPVRSGTSTSRPLPHHSQTSPSTLRPCGVGIRGASRYRGNPRMSVQLQLLRPHDPTRSVSRPASDRRDSRRVCNVGAAVSQTQAGDVV